MRHPLMYIASLLLLPILSHAQISDAEFFSRINLDYPGLNQVKQAVTRGDYAAARQAYATFQRERSTPEHKFPRQLPRDYPSNKRKESSNPAEKALQNRFTSVGYEYHFADGDIDWLFNPTDKNQNPSYNGNYRREWTVQFNRLSYLRNLAAAFRDTGNPIYVEKADAMLNDWIGDVPPKHPTGDERWLSGWRTLEAGIRVGEEWAYAWPYFIKAPELKDETIVRWVKSWMQHGDYLTQYSGTLNWFITESHGLFNIGALFPEFKDAQAWRAEAVDRLSGELQANFYPDGAHTELTPHYHRIAMEAYVQLMISARKNNYPVDPQYLGSIEDMFDYLIKICMPNRQTPRINDSKTEDIKYILDYQGGRELFPNRQDFLFFTNNGGAPPDYTSVLLPWAGQAVMRENWTRESNYLLFEYGPYGTGSHQHEDKLGIHIGGYGEMFVIETGLEDYGQTTSRSYSLKSQAHSTLSIDGETQARKYESSLQRADQPYPVVWTNSTRFDYARGEYGVNRREVWGKDQKYLGEWKRHVLYLKPDVYVVIDQITPDDDREHRYQSHFHLNSSNASLDNSTQRVSIQENGRPGFSITPLQVDNLTTTITKGQRSPEYLGWELFASRGDRQIPTARYEQKTAGPTVLSYIFQANPNGQAPPKPKVEALSTGNPELFGIAIQETMGDLGPVKIILNKTGQPTLTWNDQTFSTPAIIIFEKENKTYDLHSGDLLAEAGNDDQPAAIRGMVWEDRNGNGVRDEAAGAGLPNIPVGLVDALTGNTVVITSTNSEGRYQINDITPGEYYLQITTSDWLFAARNATQQSDLDSDFDPDRGITAVFPLKSREEKKEIDAGLYLPITLGDLVWHDLNRDGIQNPDEKGLDQVGVVLYDDQDQLLTSGNTDANGIFRFDRLPPGKYKVKIDPANFTDQKPLWGMMPTTNAVDYSLSTTDLESGDNDFDLDFGFAYNDIAPPLPTITLEITVQNQDVLLRWFTFNEQNIAHFEIERSTDGMQFNKIAQVAAKGAGNSGRTEYTYVDENVASKNYYYRVKQVGTNSSSNLSQMVEVDLRPTEESQKQKIRSFPNPFRDRIVLDLHDRKITSAFIEIYDQWGHRVLERRFDAPLNEIYLDVAHLRPGTYFLKMQSNRKNALLKISKF